ncbi:MULTISPECIES: transglutaminase domain-containing protein [unclassified Haloferax]|uniref:transglutaminase TgpA family protein n=1 Tax=unclassified Haloferax TaxID=2625095 RepID=UPI00287695D0|nr:MULTISPECIES: transglutaminase domain-containing protein [unclassified Haloferax]MDS0241344.1 DUF3488 and transglutaminase-like domain-containing protein [Haloferax sp. S2CR25]MDS0444465.1 DUF3488 and transglutaminase-like domain-containing protein [Haloferax sp. S2CR25-2]
MSTRFSTDRWAELVTGTEKEAQAVSVWPRRLTLLAGLVLIGSFLSPLYHITDVVGGVGWLVLAVASAFGVGTIAARVLPAKIGLGVGVFLFVLGLGGYLWAIPNAYVALLSFRLLSDLVVLVLGELSVLQIVRADLWAIAIAPAPVFGTWYLLVRRRYDLAAWVGGLTLLFFVLTGDASEALTLVGVAGAMGVLGFGSLDRAGASWPQIREIGLVLTAVIVVSRLALPVTARLTTSPSDSPVSGLSGSSQTLTLEGSLINAPDRVGILGGISLSPEVRFTVTADRPAFWHVAAYDRFTGGSWVRSGETTTYSGPLPTPPGETQTLEQTFEAAAAVNTMPAAWKPVRVGTDIAQRTRVTDLGGLQPTRSLSDGEAYSVTSERPQWTTSQLRNADEDIPDPIRNRYLQLPTSTPERVGRLSAELTADADTWFDKAAAIEQWLERNKEYSLDITRPDGNIADRFIFEMERGYCVYYATAMATMLRTLGIPARFTVGYTTGQSVADNQWVIRGFNSHAWVEVFFPEIGWVSFDPTPSGPRQAARQQQLEDARAANTDGIDTSRTRPTTTPSLSTVSSSQNNTTTAETGASQAPDIDSSALGNDSDTNLTQVDEQRGAVASDPEMTTIGAGALRQNGQETTGVSRRSLFTNFSDTDQVAIVAGVIGAALGINRFSLLRRGYEFVELGWQASTDSPQADVERAFDRLEQVLARQYRARRSGETRREYIRMLRTTGRKDDRLQRILAIYELAVYGGEVSPARADEAIGLVDDIVRERLFSMNHRIS